MPKLTNSAPKNNRKTIMAILTVVALMTVIGFLFTFFYSNYLPNYAAIEAKPIEQALLQKGAMKKCERSGNGLTGIDYKDSSYGAYYELPLQRQAAIDLIKEISANNGYTVEQAKHGRLPMPDDVAQNYYIDHKNKPNPYERHEPGPIKLTLEIINSGNLELSSAVCGEGDKTIKNDNNNTAIRLELRLPDVKDNM